MPERTGGSPSYAYPAFKDRWPRFAKHINGFTAWAYWLGWFPVAPLNMILASFYLADRFHLNTTSGFTPMGTVTRNRAASGPNPGKRSGPGAPE